MFQRCKNINEIKTLYRRIAHFLHPDKGGDTELMALLIECYEEQIEKHAEKLNAKFSDNKQEASEYNLVDEPVIKGDSQLDILLEIFEYGKNHKSFNLDYVSSLKEFLETHSYLTPFQYNKLVKIYYAFRMDLEKLKRKNKDGKN